MTLEFYNDKEFVFLTGPGVGKTDIITQNETHIEVREPEKLINLFGFSPDEWLLKTVVKKFAENRDRLVEKYKVKCKTYPFIDAQTYNMNKIDYTEYEDYPVKIEDPSTGQIVEFSKCKQTDDIEIKSVVYYKDSSEKEFVKSIMEVIVKLETYVNNNCESDNLVL